MKRAYILLAVLPVAGYAAGPEPKPANFILPGSFGQELPEAPADLANWWKKFNDPELSSLIDRTLRSNLNLQMAVARIQQARAAVGAAKSTGLPMLSQTNTLKHSSGPASTSTEPGLQKLLAGNGGSVDNRQFGLGVTWARNFFGGNRNIAKAAVSEVGVAEEDRRAVMVTLFGDVASYYVQLRGLQAQLAIARKGVEFRRDSLRLVDSRLAAGLATDADVTPLQLDLANAESLIPGMEASIELHVHQLAVLAGEEPSALIGELIPPRAVPDGPSDVPLGSPEELVRRRPDVRKAQQEVDAAEARTAAARAERFPQFSFTGNFGGRDQQISALKLGNSGGFFSVGPSVSIPLFAAGKIRSDIQARSAERQQADLQYQQAILQALQEVEDALAKYSHERDRKAVLEQMAGTSQRKLALARELFDAGIQDYNPVLDAEQSVIAATTQLAGSEESVTEDLIALYRALGGGWN
ncbi:MAG: efflux transporter outer membrane subunit [Bryobacterales bacterium]|nr:efflux transporter outer membrane subunit [Bryobacterales bacterium]MBV9400729.1 efflux transporter outer membrane subunit [Bryobacterales bacterium]